MREEKYPTVGAFHGQSGHPGHGGDRPYAELPTHMGGC